ncbi:MAG TPA: Hsp20 family protein [Alphaproteobacteria bacterium]|nr:Hsp20 family protein [Alphaproteobacteria bacterium]
MNRLSLFSSPFLLGFDRLEEMLDRVSRASADGYPPYDVESLGDNRLRIVLAVAGFERNELAVTVENNELVIRGKQTEDDKRMFLHRGIAARQFQRRFVLAEGIEVEGASLENGLLSILVVRPEPTTVSRTVEIRVPGDSGAKPTAAPRAAGRGEAAA